MSNFLAVSPSHLPPIKYSTKSALRFPPPSLAFTASLRNARQQNGIIKNKIKTVLKKVKGKQAGKWKQRIAEENAGNACGEKSKQFLQQLC